MNVTEQGLREYIEAFHSVLHETAEQYVPSTLRDNLFHLSLLPAHIVAYVSTQYGVAIECQPANETVVETRRGSARVEDLLVEAPKRLRLGPTAVSIAVDGIHVQIRGCKIKNCFPFRMKGLNSSVKVEDTEIEAESWRRSIHYAEVFGNRSIENWNREKAITRAKDEVLAALSELQRSKEKHISIADYVSNFKRNTVLLLGDYNDEGMERLLKLSLALRELGYNPLLVKDIPDIFSYDLGQKVVALGSVARFVVIDDSSKSGHLSEVQICKNNNWVTLLLRAEGIGGSWMTAGAAHHSKVILEKDYSPSSPEIAMVEAAEWAEAKLAELQRSFDNTYPWRNIVN